MGVMQQGERMTQVGSVFRRRREILGRSQEDIALDAGVCQSVISRVEAGHPGVTLRALAQIAATLGDELQFALVPAPDELRARARQLADQSPAMRVCRENPTYYYALRAVAVTNTSYAVTGAMAALLHGLPARVDELALSILDEDDSLLGWARFLLSTNRLWEEPTAEEVREWNLVRRWGLHGPDLVATLVTELPPVTPVDLDGVTVPIESLPSLLADPHWQQLVDRLGTLADAPQ
jgi:transcriptional regulator with XRE-family HTH domain